MHLFLKKKHPNYLHDPRAIIVIDAASVSPNVFVSSDGTVTGLINIDCKPLSETAEILNLLLILQNLLKSFQ